ncbi:MAG TPA: hypothetical protein VFS07_00705, partial [Gemmatimonadales bacterium]|nr:hypothetical protein [Gemmatimonadales bacterium]
MLAHPPSVLLPLAGLLALSRPRRRREVTMLVVASAALALWGGLIAPLAVRSMDAWVAFLTGAFLVLVATRPGRMWDHALVAALVASLAFAAGLKALHIAPAAVSYSAERIVAQATQPYLSLF